MTRRQLRYPRLLAVVVALLGLAAGYVAAFGLPGTDAQTTSYTGCVSRYTGQLRVLISGGACTANEAPITFGQTGPPGPPGPPGPAGALGSAIHAGYNGAPLMLAPAIPSFVPFDTTFTAVGTNISHLPPSDFVVAEGGLYRVDFILQGDLQGAGSARVSVNGVPVGPDFRLVTAVIAFGDQQQLSGSVLVNLAAGDIVQIGVIGAIVPLSSINAGTSLIITQLTSPTSP